MTRYVKFKAPYLPSFDFRVLQMSCIWQNIIKLSLSSWWMWLEMGNRMIDMDFQFQTWHALWSSRLHIFFLFTSRSSRRLVFEIIFSNHHNLNDQYDEKWKIGWWIWILNFKRDMLYEIQCSISSFFRLQGPPDDFHLTDYYQIIIIIMMNMIRNGK